MVGIQTPIGHEIQLRIEQLPIQLITRQVAPAAFTQDFQHRFGVLHYAYPSMSKSNRLAPFALWTAFPSSLAGRYACDYYGASVTHEARASMDDPTFVPVVRIERDLGAPLISFNSLIGNRSASRRVRRPSSHVVAGIGTGVRRLSDG